MAESDDPITEVDEAVLEESSDDSQLPDEVVLLSVTVLMTIATVAVFLVDSIPNGSAVMPGTIAVGTAGLAVRAYLR
ncbi:MAG: hypothetical protein ABEI99_10030 [Halobaculum sp.]